MHGYPEYGFPALQIALRSTSGCANTARHIAQCELYAESIGAFFDIISSAGLLRYERPQAAASQCAAATPNQERCVSTGFITRHATTGEVAVYRIPVRAFPMLVAYVHIVIAGDYVALVDAGSGSPQSDADLHEGFAALRSEWGVPLEWGDIRRIIVTHAHIDHYGGLTAVRRHTDAPIAVHVLDRRVLTNHAERLTLATRAVAEYLRHAGVPAAEHTQLIDMYGMSKELFRSVAVADTLAHGARLDDLFTVYHVPGHCPGQVCLQVEDLLLTADHVLPQTAPFLAPESITPWTGAGHFLEGLAQIARVPGVRLALGGHEDPIEDFYECVARAEQGQYQRIERVRTACAEPHTIYEVARTLYPELSGYQRLLALQKVGAYVEYLDQRGELAIANLDEVAADAAIAPRYHGTAEP
jgi:glyoxylase-like metal-dependent hydrolase (beta-lactamase superfamily II)